MKSAEQWLMELDANETNVAVCTVSEISQIQSDARLDLEAKVKSQQALIETLEQSNAGLREALELIIPPIENQNFPGDSEMRKAKAALSTQPSPSNWIRRSVADELAKALMGLIEIGDPHEPDCPCDDTCTCHLAKFINGALKTYHSTK